MSQPTQNDLHPIDPVLTNLAIGYMNQDVNFVAERFLSPVPVNEKSGTYFIFDKKYWFLDEMQRRAPGGAYARAGYGLSTDTYATAQWALAHPIADEDRAASQLPMDLETAGIKFLSHLAMIRKEIEFASTFMTTNVWTTDNTTATDWDDTTSGDPVADVLAGKLVVKQLTGFTPNVMLLGDVVHNALQVHPDLIDRIKFTTAATAQNIESALAAIFGVSRYLVGGAIYNTANESATATLAAMIDDDCLLAYQDPAAGVFGATAAKMFTWAPGGGPGGIRPLFRDDANDADLLKFKMQWSMKKTSADLGYFFSDIV